MPLLGALTLRRAACALILSLAGSAGVSGCGRTEVPPPAPKAEPSPPRAASSLDGSAIVARARRIAGLGPRMPGTLGHKLASELIVSELREAGVDSARIRRDFWTEQVPSPSGPLQPSAMVNIIATLAGPGESAIAIAAHYDTPKILGAVGATSSAAPVALIIELARHLVEDRPTDLRSTIHLVFLDAEEAIGDWDDGHHCYGSRRLANDPAFRCDAFIKVGGLGANDLAIADDTNSSRVLKAHAEAAGRAVLGRSPFGHGFEVLSDHLIFAERGIPSIALYDAEAPNAPWVVNPTEDVPSILRAEPLAQAGALILSLISRIDATLGR